MWSVQEWSKISPPPPKRSTDTPGGGSTLRPAHQLHTTQQFLQSSRVSPLLPSASFFASKMVHSHQQWYKWCVVYLHEGNGYFLPVVTHTHCKGTNDPKYSLSCSPPQVTLWETYTDTHRGAVAKKSHFLSSTPAKQSLQRVTGHPLLSIKHIHAQLYVQHTPRVLSRWTDWGDPYNYYWTKHRSNTFPSPIG